MTSQAFFLFFIFLLFFLLISEGTEYELKSKEEQLLEKISSLEVKVGILENQAEMRSKVIKDVIAKEIAEIKTALEPLNEKHRKLSEDVATLKAIKINKTVESTHAVETDNDPVIAFSAHNPTRSSLSIGQTFVFGSVALNEGNGYNSSSGEFTAPAGGLYQFSVHVCNGGGKHVASAIVHDDTYVAYSVQYQPSGSSCSSVNALLMMTPGQKVLVKCTYSTWFTEDQYRRATFMGVLIHKTA
ncbi:complement C1q tumor necrosis factor-related protein 2-like [Mercenaria mercenaria]|uniref:complement C1q tumor necrosis factor-related protein 2-like n=1 Tax=Mercenaria mercenaria TaxID=6596 RepID=UPI00234E5EFC|nr:complement C1q tumor necrosis factor-related protein 2-like [Mercenaria mercenaria]